MGSSSIDGGTLTILKFAFAGNPTLSYGGGTGPDLSAFTKLVLQNVTQFSTSPRVSIDGPDGELVIVGVPVGNTVEFELGFLLPNTLAAPTGLVLAADAATAVASTLIASGPFIAQ